MPRTKSNSTAKKQVAEKVTAVLNALDRLRKAGELNANHLTESDIQKMRTELERKVSSVGQSILYEHQLSKGKVKKDGFTF